MTPDERVAAIRERLDTATPGPWLIVGDIVPWHPGMAGEEEPRGASVMAGKHTYVVAGGHSSEWDSNVGVLRDDDAAFITNAPDDVRYLLDRLAAAERREDTFTATRDAFYDYEGPEQSAEHCRLWDEYETAMSAIVAASRARA